MECRSQFVDALMAITGAPLGAVAGALAAEDPPETVQTWPGKDLCASMSNLRSELFLSPMAEALWNPMDLEILSTDKALAETTKLSVKMSHQVMHEEKAESIKLTSKGQAWNANVLLDFEGKQDFELMLTTQGPASSSLFLGIATADVNLAAPNLYTTAGYFMYLQYSGTCCLHGKDGTQGKSMGLTPKGCLKMRLSDGGSNPVLQYAFGDSSYVTATFNQAIPPNQSYCPVVLLSEVNQTATVECKCSRMESSPPIKAVMNPTVKFLVSNRLQVQENSSAAAIELIAQRNGESLAGLRTQSVPVTASVWRRLIAGALLGRDDILDFAFPAAAADPAGANGDGDDASTAGDSEASFQLTFPEEPACQRAEAGSRR